MSGYIDANHRFCREDIHNLYEALLTDKRLTSHFLRAEPRYISSRGICCRACAFIKEYKIVDGEMKALA